MDASIADPPIHGPRPFSMLPKELDSYMNDCWSIRVFGDGPSMEKRVPTWKSEGERL